MFALRKLAWLFAALWILTQSAVFAHGFDDHSAEHDCTVCAQIQLLDDSAAGDSTEQTVPSAPHPAIALPVLQSVEHRTIRHNQPRAPPATI